MIVTVAVLIAPAPDVLAASNKIWATQNSPNAVEIELDKEYTEEEL